MAQKPTGAASVRITDLIICRPEIAAYGVGMINGVPSVGGGHQNRALAHGYSISTPSGLGRRPGRTQSDARGQRFRAGG
jgi:hypothetical protein